MKEALLHYIWKNTLFAAKDYIADTGEKVTIAQIGIYNTDQGPDFTQAHVIIDNTRWIGNIEIHKHASDWYAHRHHKNPDYNNVILHVVSDNNKECYNEKGRRVPCIKLAYSEEIEQNYQLLLNSDKVVACNDQIKQLDLAHIDMWFPALVVDRLESKTETIQELLAATNNSWEEAFYIHLFRSFGLRINALPFELLAKSLPFKIILQEPYNIFRTEALLFGQAGFLDEPPADEYCQSLKREYAFQKRKYKLKPLDKHLWKFLRLRPLNFPTIRIAQLAGMLSGSGTIFSDVMELKTPHDFVNYFSCGVSAYWKNHYTFGNTSAAAGKKIGKSTVYLIAINTVIPFMFYYGSHKNNEDLKERAFSLLEQLPPEKNSIVAGWSKAGVKAKNASQSQALLALTQSYCNAKKCLECQIGHSIINPNKLCSAKV